MDQENLYRELKKVKEAVSLAVTYHMKDNEKNAALHASTEVLYSPLTNKLRTASRSLGTILDDLQLELDEDVGE